MSPAGRNASRRRLAVSENADSPRPEGTTATFVKPRRSRPRPKIAPAVRPSASKWQKTMTRSEAVKRLRKAAAVAYASAKAWSVGATLKSVVICSGTLAVPGALGNVGAY